MKPTLFKVKGETEIRVMEDIRINSNCSGQIVQDSNGYIFNIEDIEFVDSPF